MSHHPRRPRWHTIRIVLPVLACVALSACSALRLAYDQLPALAQWRLDSYLDLSSAQTQRVRGDLEDIMRWHRSAQLPQQIALVRTTRQQLGDKLSPQQVCATYETVRKHMLTLSEQAQPMAVWLAMNLSAQQLARLEQRQAKDNQAWREAWLEGSDQQRLQARQTRWVANIERVYGPLGDPLQAVVRDALATNPFDAQSAWQLRVTRQQDWLTTLRAVQRERPPVERVHQMVQGLIARNFSPNDADQRAQSQRWREDGCRVFAQVHNATSQAQRQTAMRTLSGYEADFQALMGAF